jgi:Glycosyl transferase family 2
MAETYFSAQEAPVAVATGRTEVRLAVIVASVSRSEEIGQLLFHLERQSQKPSSIVLSVERQSDLPEMMDPGIQVVLGPRGLTAQRNRGMERVLKNSDIIVFFDDDFVPANDAVEKIIEFFEKNKDIIGATGKVLRDGIKLGGLTYDQAILALEAHQLAENNRRIINVDTDSLYGCNMAFRSAAIGDSRFDEKLPLYAWQEDVDFAGQLLAKGRLVKTTAFSGVHRGVTRGRTPGVALGYSQMVNPAYLVRKGTMRPMKALELLLKNFIANHIRALCPEAFIDRAGRLRGNWLGLWHIVTGHPDPGMVLRLH